MTRKFNVHYTCEHCGKQSTAETGFGRWMRNCRELDSANGIVRTDTDHIICRYKTSMQGRDFQLLMVVEVKEYASEPDPSQTDLLSFLRQLCERTSKNIRGAVTVGTHKLKSRMLGRKVNVRWYGVHLLQFEKTNPGNGWVKWNRKIIDEATLIGLLSFERIPSDPQRMIDGVLRDRHSQTKQMRLIA